MQRTILLWYGFFWLSAARRKSRCRQLHRKTLHPFDYVLVAAIMKEKFTARSLVGLGLLTAGIGLIIGFSL